MNSWNPEFVEKISQTMQKHGQNGDHITCAKLLVLMGEDPEAEEEVRLCIKKSLSGMIESKRGISGGYALRDAVVTKNAIDPLLAQDVRDKIEAAHKKGVKITIEDIKHELNIRHRKDIEAILKTMPEFTPTRTKGVIKTESNEQP